MATSRLCTIEKAPLNDCLMPRFSRTGSSAVLLSVLFLAGCSSVSMPSMSGLWPFGDGLQGREPAPPANATPYRCDGNRGFFVRTLPSGSVWVILPEREFRLDKAVGDGAAAGRYSNGIAVLEIKGDEALLNDGPGQAYIGCREPKAVAPTKG